MPKALSIGEWLGEATRILSEAGIATARLDVIVLLEDATAMDRASLLAHPETRLSQKDLEILNQHIIRRAGHEPLAYIRGRSEFYGREFYVNSHTLQPRPETETMIDMLKRLGVTDDACIADIGTGSGCIAITSKLLFPSSKVFATEIDPAALSIAEKNASRHKTDVLFYQGDLLEPLSQPVDIIMANLPYVPDSHTINPAAMQEPSHAIFGGQDGLDLYRRMFEQADRLNHKPVYVLAESLPFQHQQMVALAENHGYVIKDADDFIQLFERRA